MDRWMGGWMGGWINVCMYVCMYVCMFMYTFTLCIHHTCVALHATALCRFLDVSQNNK